jgi:predicted ribosome quality control (RQC) complex YloA/Tae2 family protein
MNEATLAAVAADLEKKLVGRLFGKIFQLSRLALAIDFRLSDSEYLFVAAEPINPRIYLIKRKLRELEKQSANPSPFALFLRKRLANAVLQSVGKLENERVLRFEFLARDEIEAAKRYTLVVQLTGRSANLFLLDERDFILDSLRENTGDGQEIATRFAPPARAVGEPVKRIDETPFPPGDFATLSEALDAHFLNRERESRFQARAKAAAAKIKAEIARREKLARKLEQDLENHGDAEKWKRSGDLILANLADAVRVDGKILVVDYFDETTPTVEIEADENLSLTETAEKFFRRYAKARNAKEEISKRLAILQAELSNLNLRKQELETAVAEKDEAFLSAVVGDGGGEFGKEASKATKEKSGRDASGFKGARKFVSSDGFEILVGKASKDNDYLTFRVAKSLDFWLHAADYGGSHVVVRNPNRLETLPPRTLIEAAELAAFYSQGKNQVKAAVNYTQKKFVNKPKGAPPGLVSLSSFKTILVEPKISLESKVLSQKS